MTDKIIPCLWFDGDAEAATAFYVSLLPDSRITAVVLVATGAYLVWYWWPAAIGSTGGAAMGSTAWSAAVSIWIQNHTGTVIILAVAAVAATLAATVVARNTRARHRDATPDNDCCAPAPATIEEKHAR